MASRGTDLVREAASISPAVVLELELLHEIGRLCAASAPIAQHLAERLAINVAGDRFADVVFEAVALRFTRDPFDPLMTAHAALLAAPLVTLNGTLQRHFSRAMH